MKAFSWELGDNGSYSGDDHGAGDGWINGGGAGAQNIDGRGPSPSGRPSGDGWSGSPEQHEGDGP